MKKGVKILLAVLALVLAAGVFIFCVLSSSMKKMEAMENVEAVDMAQVADGVYSGSADSGIVKVKVQVEVKDHEIKSIDLIEHQNGKGKPAEAILDEMIAENTDDVDAVSGATMSSVAIRSAVNEALRQGLEK